MGFIPMFAIGSNSLNKLYLVSKPQRWISLRSRDMDFWSSSRDPLIDDREMNIFEQGVAWTVMAAPMIPLFVSRNIALLINTKNIEILHWNVEY